MHVYSNFACIMIELISTDANKNPKGQLVPNVAFPMTSQPFLRIARRKVDGALHGILQLIIYHDA